MVQFLLEKGYLKPEQYAEAQKVQQQTGQSLDRVLISLNMVGEREVLQAKAQEMGYGFVDLDRIQIESSAINVVPERLVKQHTAIPVKKDATTLWVAMSNPSNIVAIDDIKMASGCRVIPVVAVPGALEDAIRKYYSGGDSTPAPTAAAAAAPAAAAPGQTVADMNRFIAEARVKQGRDGDDTDSDADAEKMADQAPIIKLANALVQQAIADRASDIHVEPQQRAVRVRYRIDGVLQEAMTVPRNLMAPLISRFKIMADMNIAERRAPQDGRIEVRNAGKEYDLRVSSIPTPFGEKIVMRILDKSSTMVGLGKIGFTEENQIKVEELTAQPNGMFLCTGPTGSGKTTTLYSVLHKLNTVGVNIVTAEDPIEYQIGGIAQVQMNRKANLTFATALRAFLRQDPDIIMVGEIRDLETADIAIKAAQTGHMVMSTLHTNDAPGTLTRLGNMGVPAFNIVSSVILITAQRLARRLCTCKQPTELSREALLAAGFKDSDLDGSWVPYKAVGCERCKNSGYKGRVGIYQVMPISEPIQQIILRGGSSLEIAQQAQMDGVSDLRQSGLRKVKQGLTSIEEVLGCTNE